MDELLSTRAPPGLINNSAFTPTTGAQAAHEPFIGTLDLGEVRMTTEPPTITSTLIEGRDPRIFPSARLSFFTAGGDLVPVSQEILPTGSALGGHSYWDLLVQPGRVWSDPHDNGWSRAAFPFALVNTLEGESHNGVATFLYHRGAHRQDRVSNLRFQIVQQTAPFSVATLFTATGQAPARYQAFTRTRAAWRRAARLYWLAKAKPLRIAPWSALEKRVGAEALQGFDGVLDPSAIVLSGLDDHGVLYLKPCETPAGPLPWCDRARFGVWSVTKSLATSTALLRLAQKYGPGVFDLKIADYVPELAASGSWRDVRFADAISMATGVGGGGDTREPNNITAGADDPAYITWYEALSRHDKLAAIAAASPAHAWGPGQVARYRDQDMFVLGAAMDGYLKSREGPGADIWTMVEREVFAPNGVYHAPMARTREADGRPGLPLMAYGYYPTVGDIIRVARLYQRRGALDGRQLLYRPRIDDIFAAPLARTFPTGKVTLTGETRYFSSFWETPFRRGASCGGYAPYMLGYGGNLVALLPGGLIGLRLAKDAAPFDNTIHDTSGMAATAVALLKRCPS